MLLNKIYDVLKEREECNWESEANSLYYIVTYIDNQVIIYEIEEYHFDGDNFGEIDVKNYKHQIGNIDANIEEYVQAICTYANYVAQSNGKEIIAYEYGYLSHGIYFKIENI